MAKIPEKIRKEIHQYVYKLADEHNYLTKSRPENGAFLQQLVDNPKVGGRLKEFYRPERVKTYIKDAIINPYSKQKRAFLLDVGPILEGLYGLLHEIESDKLNFVSLHRTEDNRYIAVARTGFISWQTGLRKLLEYLVRASGLSNNPVELVLVIFQHGCIVNEGNKLLTEKGLALVNVKCVWV